MLPGGSRRLARLAAAAVAVLRVQLQRPEERRQFSAIG